MKARYIILTIVILFVVYMVGYFFFMPNIYLDDSNNNVINYKEEYKNPKYFAFYHGKDVSSSVKINGHVNTNKLGVYKVEYSIKKGFFKKKVVRRIKVRDLTKPVITFSDGEGGKLQLCPNQKYDIKNYKVYDNYDKDLTDKVKVTKKNNVVTYAVVDSSGNYTIKKRYLIQNDKEKPIIKLNSSDIVFSFLNDEFKDPGYEVSDNCDIDLSKKVKIKGTVDTNKTGIYPLTYEVADSSGNVSTVTRKVNIVKKLNNGTIYLTFDDGPRMGTTNIILDILKEEGVKATFFVTNRGPDELIVREYQEGHSVGLHTATHDYSIVYSGIDSYFQDLYTVHDRVLNLTGYDSRIIRFPGGSSNTISKKYKIGIMSELVDEVLKRDFKYYDWSINSGDTAGLTDSQDIYKQVISKLSHDKINVILMHDIKTYTRDALRSIIKYGKENGYNFEAITDELEPLTQKVFN